MDYISLIVLCLAIAAAFFFKVNTGLVAIAVSLVLGRAAGVSDSFLISSFNSSLFLMLFGVMYLFCIAQENKTLELLAKKTLALCKGKAKLFPPLLFVISAVISAVGPGLISVTALMAVLIVALAKEIKTEPIRLLPFGVLGSFAGGLSPITPSGIVAITVSEKSGIMGVAMPLFWRMVLTNVLYGVILYFFVFRWHKYQNTDLAENKANEPIPAFQPKQIATLAGVVLVAVLSTVFEINVGLASFAVAVILSIFRAADEGAALKKVPWNTLVMITGVGILISLVTKLGGIELLSTGLSALMGKHTASAIITALAGVMSWVSSASGVVMPTLIPTVPGLVESLQNVSAMELVIGLCVGAHFAALSPLSSCGALTLAAYSSSGEVPQKDRNRMFSQLFILSACGVGFAALCALLGLYR